MTCGHRRHALTPSWCHQRQFRRMAHGGGRSTTVDKCSVMREIRVHCPPSNGSPSAHTPPADTRIISLANVGSANDLISSLRGIASVKYATCRAVGSPLTTPNTRASAASAGALGHKSSIALTLSGLMGISRTGPDQTPPPGMPGPPPSPNGPFGPNGPSPIIQPAQIHGLQSIPPDPGFGLRASIASGYRCEGRAKIRYCNLLSPPERFLSFPTGGRAAATICIHRCLLDHVAGRHRALDNGHLRKTPA